MTNASLYRNTDAALAVSARYRHCITRLPLIPTASSLTYEELRHRIQRRLELDRRERFQVDWLDDDNIRYRIEDDLSLQDALDYFRPSETSNSSSYAFSSASSAYNAAPAIQMIVEVQVPSQISLSELASSDGDASHAESFSMGTSSSVYHSGANPERETSGYASSEVWEQVQGTSQDSFDTRQSHRSGLPPDRCDRIANDNLSQSQLDEDVDDDLRTEYAYSQSQAGAMSVADSVRYKDAASMVPLHTGVSCQVCEVEPLRGVRYVCLQCHGSPSFCQSCETSGESIQYAPHLGTHVVLRLIEPLIPSKISQPDKSVLAETLLQAAAALSRSVETNNPGPMSQTADLTSISSGDWTSKAAFAEGTDASGHVVLCSFCSELIGQGVRHLCANCPLDLPSYNHTPSSGDATPSSRAGTVRTPSTSGAQQNGDQDLPTIWTPHEGFNLCSRCEKHSLSIHNPNHFFLAIPAPRQVARSDNSVITPLRLNPYLSIDQRKGLLPPLYTEDMGWEEARLRMMAGSPAEQAATPATDAVIRMAYPPLGVAAQNAASLLRSSTSLSTGISCTSYFPRWRSRESSDNIELGRLGLHQEDSDAVSTVPTWENPASTLSAPQQVPGAYPASSPREEAPAFSPAYMQHEEEYVKSLSHQKVLCDVCIEPVKGCWRRCANCVSSFDVCPGCYEKALEMHHPTHAFAIFKRNVDIELYRSLVDHIDGYREEEDSGPTKAMLPFLLV